MARARLHHRLIAIFFGLLLAEAVFRLGIVLGVTDFPRPDLERILHRYSANRDLLYEMKPSFAAEEQGMRIRTNSEGMRDREFERAKPPGTVRIAVLGDSVTMGYLLPSYLETYPKILEAMLNYDGRRRYEVLNYGVTGYNSAQEQIVLEEKVLKAAPDVVLVGFCLNDATYTDGFAELARQTAPWSLGARLHSRVLSYLLLKHEQVQFAAGQDRTAVEHLFTRLAELQQTRRAAVGVLIFPMIAEEAQFSGMHDFGLALAQREALPFLDFAALPGMLDPSAQNTLFLPDGKHFSAAGMRAIAEALYRSPLIASDGTAFDAPAYLDSECRVPDSPANPAKGWMCPAGTAAVAWGANGGAGAATCCRADLTGATLERNWRCGAGEALVGLGSEQGRVKCAVVRGITADDTPAFLVTSNTAWAPPLLRLAQRHAGAACVCPKQTNLQGLLGGEDCGEPCGRVK